MTNRQAKEIATEAVRIYFDFDVSAKEAIERAKEELSCSKKEECREGC